jgi:hypothetical protein
MQHEWWEKTVEYAFVIAAFQAGKCDFASPLAGKHERLASDAVFVKAASFILIEFKRSEAEIRSEASLFSNFDDAEPKLAGYRHHHVVFGSVSTGADISLELAAQPYVGGPRYGSALECLRNGATADEFKEYLELLAELKEEDGRSTTGHVSPESMSTVLGVSADGKVVSAQPLYEHSPGLFPVEREGNEYTPSRPAGRRPGW